MHKVSQFLSRPLHIAALAVVVSVMAITPVVRADQYQDQINALSAQNAQTQSLVSGLQSQAASYQDAINQLQGQINGLQASINENEAEQASLQAQITQYQQQIDAEKAVLATDLKTMYVDGVPSTLEVLATSKSLSDFVDKQSYRNAIQQKLQDTLTQIAKLQADLQAKKTAVDQLLAEQKDQQSQLASAQAQQAGLLAMNKSQQTAYNKQIQTNSSKIASLRAQQAAANATLGGKLISSGVCGGGYPAQAVGALGTYWGCNYGLDNTLDKWGMYNRECVSYTAYKVYATYGYMPYWGGQGNANEWPGDARRAGIRVTDGNPDQSDVNTVAIWDTGAYGHAMWVEAVNSDGSILVSQYNYSYDGKYSVMTMPANRAATFHYIHFGG